MKRNTRLVSWELLTLVSHVFLGVEMSMWLPDLGKIAECNVHTMMSAILAKPLLLDHKTIGLGSGFARSQTKMVRLANAFWGPYVSLAQVDIDKMCKKWSRWLPKSAFLFYMPQPIDNHLDWSQALSQDFTCFRCTSSLPSQRAYSVYRSGSSFWISKPQLYIALPGRGWVAQTLAQTSYSYVFLPKWS